jgi:hypothetical protein
VRSGCVIAVLALAVIAVVARKAIVDSNLLRALVGGLCLFTLVVLGSALHRLQLYVGAYGYSRLRLIGAAICVFIGLVLLLVIAAGVLGRATWLPQAVLAAAVATVLGLAAVNPDALIARTVIHRYQHDGHLDAYYLSELSVDAVDAVDRLPEPQRSCILTEFASGLPRSESWYVYNASRAHARAVLARRPAGVCDWSRF